MFDTPAALVEEVRRLVDALDPAGMTPADAAAVLSELAVAARVAASGVTVLAQRASDSTVWRKANHHDVGSWVAAELGVSVTDGRRLVEASHRLAGSPDVRAAMASGAISPLAAAEVLAGKAAAEQARCRAEQHRRDDALRRQTEADAAAEAGELFDPGDLEPEPEGGAPAGKSPEEVEREMLALAAQAAHLHRLRQEAARQAAAARDQQAQAEHLRRTRAWRERVFDDGAVGGEYRLPPEDAARVNGAIKAEMERIFHEARRAGTHEPRDAYGADALCRLIDASSAPTVDGAEPTKTKPKVEIVLRVDAEALRRDHLLPGERCEIAGVGPVSLQAARDLLGDAVVHVVIHDGVDILNVTCLGRRLSRELKIALGEKDPYCVDCGTEFHLEDDHDTPVALDGPTTLANLHGRCRRCHRLKTRREASATIRAGRRRARTIADMNELARRRAHALINTS